jgi:hypothetical protein
METHEDLFHVPHELKLQNPNLNIIVLFALQGSLNMEFSCGDLL